MNFRIVLASIPTQQQQNMIKLLLSSFSDQLQSNLDQQTTTPHALNTIQQLLSLNQIALLVKFKPHCEVVHGQLLDKVRS